MLKLWRKTSTTKTWLASLGFGAGAASTSSYAFDGRHSYLQVHTPPISTR